MEIQIIIAFSLIAIVLVQFILDYKKQRINPYQYLKGKFSPMPAVGDRIEITWLPNPRNHPKIKNCHIGSRGTVTHVDPTGDGFDLELESGGRLLIYGNEFQYIKLEDEPAYIYDI